MTTTPQTLKSRLYRLETKDGEQQWVQKCQGYPLFRKEDNIFKLKFYSMPNRQLFYEVIVNSNINFERNQSIKQAIADGIEWTQIKQNEVMAISFKQQFSANAFWQLIEQYKRNYAVTVSAALDTLFYFEYRVPDPTPENLNEVLIQLENIPETERHQRVASIFLTKRQLLPKLANAFKQIEGGRQIDLPRLHTMFKIMKIVFNSCNEEMLYELMSNDYYMFFLGALEYDPNFSSVKHRQFMKHQSKLLQVVPFKNIDLTNLIVITYRLQYVKECVLSAYLNDYAIYCSTMIIKNNYKKIFNYIFNPKKKDFINTLFDMLRTQDLMAYRLLEQIFRIGKSINADDIYLHIAQRDFFEITIRNIKEQSGIESSIKMKKKKSTQHLNQIVKICLQILVQFMESEPLHLKSFCINQTQKISKYPSLNFMMDYYQVSPPHHRQKMKKILQELVATEKQHPIQELTHPKVLEKILSQSPNFLLWLPIFARIVTPFNPLINNEIIPLINLFTSKIITLSKHHQIMVINILKDLIFTYFNTKTNIDETLLEFAKSFSQFLANNKGNIGIRVSTFLSILTPKRFHQLGQKIIQELESLNKALLKHYIILIRKIIDREQVSLDETLKREKSKQLFDEENFQSINKKVKLN